MTAFASAMMFAPLSQAQSAEAVKTLPTQQERELKEINLKLRELIDALVKSGALDEEVVKEFLRDTNEKIVEQYGPVQEEQTPANLEQKPSDDVIRVPYIPEFIKDEIRQQVREELSEEVTENVVATAKEEQWGVPGALPGWIQNARFFGDVRVRAQYNIFDDDNDTQYPNAMAINNGVNVATGGEEVFYDFTNNTQVGRVRFRLGVQTDLSPYARATARIATGNRNNPVSSNHTLDADTSSDIYLDQAYIELYTRSKSVRFIGGQMKNPFFRNSEVVWDNDFSMPGAVLEYSPLRSMQNVNPAIDPYIRAGYIPLDELDLGQQDKFAYAGQIGSSFQFNDTTELEFAIAYYDFNNVTGVRNPVLDQGLTDDTAPDFLQKGNTLFNIANSSTSGEFLLALASEFEVLDVGSTLTMDLSERYEAQVNLNYVKNVGWDDETFYGNVGADPTGFVVLFGDPVQYSKEDEAYEVSFTIGDKAVDAFNRWRTTITYRSVEKDAVLDAYTNSDFHLGGTDNRGYIFSLEYGLTNNTWLHTRYLSSNEVQGLSQAGLRIDVLQVDLNMKF